MSFTRRSGSGPPQQTSRRKDRYIVRNARVQPTASSAAIQAQLALSLGAAVSSRTWLKDIWDRGAYYLGESRFNLSSDDNRVRVWRPRSERLNPAFASQRHTPPAAGVMVWDALSYNTRSPLVLIRGTMTAQRFIHDILQPHVLPLIQRLKTMLGLTRLSPHCYSPSWSARSRYFSPFEPLERCQVIYSQFGLAIHQNDHQARRRFVEWAQNEIDVVPDFHKLILFSDEAHFWLNGYVNKQNCRIWSEANPQVYVETPLHPEKLTVWCTLWAELRFQQDGATCHTARAPIDLLKDTFGDRLISRFGPVNWPPRSCDLTPLDYFLWGYVKSLVYADKPQTLDHLEDNIRRVIADIRPQRLEKVIENWTSRLDYIRASRGSPMPEIIFKM
ncbi:putative DD41D transposase [Trichonephila clavipes]|nr:putative DD41D transposase [Trichonephila clavipes]